MATTTYVALLRGVNLGGRSRVSMGALRQLVEDVGHDEVETYLQSGNVVFRAGGSTGAAALARELEERIERDLGVATAVLLRSAGDIAGVVRANPFTGRQDDPRKLHVTFLSGEPAADRAGGLATPVGQPDELALAGREVYLHCPNGYGRTKLNNAYLERRLGVPATTRNWKTVTALHEMAGG